MNQLELFDTVTLIHRTEEAHRSPRLCLRLLVTFHGPQDLADIHVDLVDPDGPTWITQQDAKGIPLRSVAHVLASLVPRYHERVMRQLELF